MSQGFWVDRPVLLAYLACLAAGCRSEPGPLVPVGAQPVSQSEVATWVASTLPSDPHRYRFKWLFRDERGSAGGRGSVRVAPPDSLRFDVAGPFGSGTASAVVIGDHALWTEPEDAIARLVPNYPLMWAMFGIARMPTGTAELRGLVNGSITMWQYAGPEDTVAYARTVGDTGRLIAQVRHRGKLVGQAEATVAANGAPVKARLRVPDPPAQLDLTFLSVARDSFAPEIWLPPRH
jgi:hypothetical protein